MPYLAMTGAEIRSCPQLPPKLAWMACHFSPYGTGLTNLPKQLPPGSLLILNDRTPIHGHDAGLIAELLEERIRALDCAGLLLDFQRPDCNEAAKIAEALRALPCPVCLSACCAQDWDGPVFLPPVPLLHSFEEYLAPWQGREIWLDAALDGIAVTVTEKGATTAPLTPGEQPDCPHFDEELLCHYRIDVAPDKAVFALRRTKEDLCALLTRAENHAITTAVGLWQELDR